jgi:hypothetical protein
MEYSGAGGKLIHEKNQKQKISWHCPFKIILSEFLNEPRNVLKTMNVRSCPWMFSDTGREE